jgi:ribosomal protein S6--L-glutamate ligase
MEEHSSVALVELPVGPGRWTKPLPDATRVAMLGTEATATNLAIVEAWGALGVDIALVRPDAISTIRPGDIVLGRIDILPTIDGVEPGLLDLLWLDRRGFRVLNSATALASAHDKLLTARLLARAALPHPRTVHVRRAGDLHELRPPVVVKPRLGSWGVDVHRCDTEEDLRECFEEIVTRPWFPRHGVLVQELVPPRGYDLRLLVADRTVVGAVRRVAGPGEWRTNVSLGATRHPVVPPPAACALGIAAAVACRADFIGIDLLPHGDGYTVIELNGAADFNETYSLPGRDVFHDAAAGLGLVQAAAT